VNERKRKTRRESRGKKVPLTSISQKRRVDRKKPDSKKHEMELKWTMEKTCNRKANMKKCMRT